MVKWSTVNNTLMNTQIVDDGHHIGLPATRSYAFANIETAADSMALSIQNTWDRATSVINARYNTSGNPNHVSAVVGVSNYLNPTGQTTGTGGRFTGGYMGVWAEAFANGGPDAFGVRGYAAHGWDSNRGVSGKALGTGMAINIGLIGDADSSDNINAGLSASAGYNSSTGANIGIAAEALNSGYLNAAGMFNATGTTGDNYGIFAGTATTGTGYYAAYFDGDVHATGTVTWTSDERLKTNIKNVSGQTALDKIARLQPKTYTFKQADYPYLALPQGNQYGLLAQEVEQVLPELVKTIKQPEIKNVKTGDVTSPALEYKGLNYAGLIPLLVGAVNQQQAKIDSLTNVIETRLAAMEERLAGCCGRGKRDAGDDNSNTAVNRLSVELNSMQVVVLEQNVPNPFAEQTSIQYFVPEDVNTAQIVFTDMLGRIIKTVEIEKGYGGMTVFAGSLGKGQYTYSLLIDGKTIETKKMVKTK